MTARSTSPPLEEERRSPGKKERHRNRKQNDAKAYPSPLSNASPARRKPPQNFPNGAHKKGRAEAKFWHRSRVNYRNRRPKIANGRPLDAPRKILP
jgi:hypothetical protein